MSSKSSKMIGWIKKRCRRRSDPFGDKLKYSEDKTMADPVYFTLETNVSEIHSGKSQDVEDHIYEEISNVPRDIASEMLKLTDKIEVEFSKNVNHSHVCPTCRNIISKDELCKCIEVNKVSDQEQNIYELATNPWISQNGSTRKQPDVPIYLQEQKVDVNISICDDSSGYYESMGSDCITTLVYRPDSEESGFDDDDYEEIDVLPGASTKRRCSMSSLPLHLSNIHKFHFKTPRTSTSRSKTFHNKSTFINVPKQH